MKKMTKLMALVLVLVMALCAFTACGSEEDKVKKVAEKFMDAYLELNFEKAAEYCDGDTADQVSEMASYFDYLDEDEVKEAKEEAKGIKCDITNVEIDEEEGTATVDMTMTNVDGDEEEAGLGMEKIDGDWKIVDLR